MNEMFASLHGDIENSFLKEEIRLPNGNVLKCLFFGAMFVEASYVILILGSAYLF